MAACCNHEFGIIEEIAVALFSIYSEGPKARNDLCYARSCSLEPVGVRRGKNIEA